MSEEAPRARGSSLSPIYNDANSGANPTLANVSIHPLQTNQGCLRVAIALVHLDTVHEGLLLGRNIAPDAIQVRNLALY